MFERAESFAAVQKIGVCCYIRRIQYLCDSSASPDLDSLGRSLVVIVTFHSWDGDIRCNGGCYDEEITDIEGSLQCVNQMEEGEASELK